MKKSNIFTVPFRRKRTGRTNYRKRLSLLKGNCPRAVVRKSLRNIIVQLITFEPRGDKVVLHADSKELQKYGWLMGCGNIPAAYLTGYLLGTRAKKRDITKATLDIGINVSTKGGRLYAALKGMLDAGINIPHNEECLPDNARVLGQHIENYANLLQQAQNKRQFSQSFKAGINMKELEQCVSRTKQRLAKEGI